MSLIDDIVSYVGLVPPVKIGDLEITDSRGLTYCHLNNARRMLSLGKPAKSVIHGDDPFLITKFKTPTPGNGPRTLLVINIGDYDRTSIKRLMNHLVSSYQVITYLELDPRDDEQLYCCLVDIYNAHYVMTINANRVLAGLVLSSQRPCCFVNPKFGLYTRVILAMSSQLSQLLITATDYRSLKSGFKIAYHDSEDCLDIIQKAIAKIKANFTMVIEYSKSWKPITERIQSLPVEGFPYSVDVTEHTDCMATTKYLTSYSKRSTPCSIFLDPFVVKSNQKDTLRLYPWIGIVEYCTPEALWYPFMSQYFERSMMYCQGIFVYDRKTKDSIDDYIERMQLNIKTRIIEVPLLQDLEQFNYDDFRETPTMINYGKTVVKFPMEITFPNSVDYDYVEIEPDNEATLEDNLDCNESSEDSQELYQGGSSVDYPDESDSQDTLQESSSEEPQEDIDVNQVALELGVFSESTDSSDVSERPETTSLVNSLLVMTGSSFPATGLTGYAISMGTPMISKSSMSSSVILGKDYPLSLERVTPQYINHIVKTENVDRAVEHFKSLKSKSLFTTFDNHLVVMKRSKIGLIISTLQGRQ